MLILWIAIVNLNLPNAKTIGINSLRNCLSLVNLNLPNATSIEDYAIYNCISLIFLDLPAVKGIGRQSLQNCLSLVNLNSPNATSIGSNAFQNCASLTTLKLGASQVATLESTSAFKNTPISKCVGYIYVPDELVEDYKVATNWSVYADQIRPMSECEE